MPSTIPDTGSLPSTNFTFGDVISNLWGGLQPVVQQGVQTWGSIQIAQLNADAQAKLNALKTQNASIGSNDPAAAQANANKTLAQRWLPSNMTEAAKSVFPWVIIGGGVLLLVFIVRRLFK